MDAGMTPAGATDARTARVDRARMRPHLGPVSLTALCLSALLAWGNASALTMQVSGYTVTPFATPTLIASGIRIGPDGTLYLHDFASSSIHRISPAGTESPWSVAQIRSLALLPTGIAIGAGGEACSCLVRIQPDGSFTTFARDSVRWHRVATAANGSVFATGQTPATSGYGAAVFEVDPLTGDRTLLAGSGFSLDLIDIAAGVDGSPYVIKYGTYPERILARVEGGSFTPIGVLPHGGFDLVPGAGTLFWTRTSHDYGSGRPIAEIWAIDSMNGSATLLAQAEWVDSSFWGVVYDPGGQRLFVGDPSHRLLQPNRVLQTISGGVLPGRSTTWGALKARYRGPPVSAPERP